MEIINNDAPWVILDTNLIIKCCIGVDITESEETLFRMIARGKINAIINPISYGEIKNNENASIILSDGSLKRNFYNESAGTGKLLVLNASDLFGEKGYFENLLSLANAYAYDKKRDKRVPYYEFNDRLIAALARILNIPLITPDSHLLGKGVQENIKKTNKRFGFDGLYSYPLTVEEYLKNLNYFRENRNYRTGPEFMFAPLTNLGAKSSAVKRTEFMIGSYREQIDASTHVQIEQLINREVLNEKNTESLVALESRLASYFDAETSFKDDEERFKKIHIAATAYMYELTAIVYFIMEFISQLKYEQAGREVLDRKGLENIENSLAKSGFTFTYNGTKLQSINYKGLSFSLCKIGTYKNYDSTDDILGQKLDDDFKVNCRVDIEKLEPATSMVLIAFSPLNTGARTDISKRYSRGLRRSGGDYKIISKEQLAKLVEATHISSLNQKTTEKDNGRKDGKEIENPAKKNVENTLDYLYRIDVEDYDKGSFSFN